MPKRHGQKVSLVRNVFDRDHVQKNVNLIQGEEM